MDEYLAKNDDLEATFGSAPGIAGSRDEVHSGGHWRRHRGMLRPVMTAAPRQVPGHWVPVPESMERVLQGMSAVPAAERVGRIDGVMIKTLRKHADQRGFFVEQLKRGDLDDEGRPFLPEQPFAQTSRSLAYARGGNPPELIKAFHWHRRQWDYWDVVQGNARVVLVDLREGSPSQGRTQSLILGEHSPLVVAIPPLVAHGYQVLDLRDVVLCYYVTEPYDPADPDEGRIAWDDPRIGFDWRIENI